MSVLNLPVQLKTEDWDQTTELDDEVFGIQFRWQSRYEAFYTGWLDAEDARILSGSRISTGTIMSSSYFRDALPAGQIQVVGQEGNETDPGVDDLGDKVKLPYMNAAEVASLSVINDPWIESIRKSAP